MIDIHCPQDVGFENTFSGEECEQEQRCNNCYRCWHKALAKRKAHWIMPANDDGMSDPIYYQVRCSKCGFDIDPQTWYEELQKYGAGKYCPKCGCQMYEDVERLLGRFAEIGKLDAGTSVEFGGLRWIILNSSYSTGETEERGVFCLAEKIIFCKAFNEDNLNNWATSSLRSFLNGEFKAQLTEEIGKDKLMLFERDLTSDDGLNNYGTCEDLISLISCDEYRRYRQYIGNKHAWWWTLTACSTPNSDSSYFVRRVHAKGYLSDGGVFNENSGVAPVVCVNPSFKVRVK